MAFTTAQRTSAPDDGWNGDDTARRHADFERRVGRVRVLARNMLRREGSVSVQLTELLNQGFVQLRGRVDFKNTEHFVGRWALAMRAWRIDRARAKGRAKHGKRPHVESLNEQRHGGHAQVDDGRRIELRHELHEAMSVLSPWQAAIIDLHCRDGHTFEEIAALFGVSASKIRRDGNGAVLLLRARLAGGLRGW